MIKSRLINLFRTFSPAEIKDLNEFVISPYHNKNKNVIKLFGIIRNSYPDFDSLEKEKVFNKLFPGKPYNENLLQMLIFYLYKISKKFLVFERIAKHENEFMHEQVKEFIDPDFYLFGEFKDRGLLKEAERILREIDSKIDREVIKGGPYYLHRFLSSYSYLNLMDKVHGGKYEKYCTGKIFEDILGNFNFYYLSRTLKLYTLIINSQMLLRTDSNIRFLEKLIASIDLNDFKTSPLIVIYYNTIQMCMNPQEEGFFYALKDLVRIHENDIERRDLLDIYVNLENYCSRKLKQGREEFGKELFELYKTEVEKKYYKHTSDEIAHHFYKGIVSVALSQKEVEWAEHFIENYKNEVSIEFREPVYYFCLSRLEFAKGNLSGSLEHLSRVVTGEVFLKTETKLILGQLYYELSFDESLRSLIDALRHYFKNEKFLSGDRKSFYLNYVRFLSKLELLKTKRDKFDLENLKKEILETESVFLKKWLIEKTAELLPEFDNKLQTHA